MTTISLHALRQAAARDFAIPSHAERALCAAWEKARPVGADVVAEFDAAWRANRVYRLHEDFRGRWLLIGAPNGTIITILRENVR